MNIIVCIKQVPDTSEISINPETGTLNRAGVESVINPLDYNALEAALRLKERYGGNVTALSMGPKQAEGAIREALAMGSDRGLLCSDKQFAGADTWATACTLEAAIRSLPAADLILCGKQAIDGDTAQVPAELAVRLNYPFLPYVHEIISVESDTIQVRSMTDTGSSRLETRLPAVCTVVKSINVPRLVSLSGWIHSFQTEIKRISADDIDIDGQNIGLRGSPTRVKKITPVSHSKKIRYLDADNDDDLDTICRILRAASKKNTKNEIEEKNESISLERTSLTAGELGSETFPGVYVLGELDPETGRCRRVSFELLGEAERLADIREADLYLVLPAPGTLKELHELDMVKIESFGVKGVFLISVSNSAGFEANSFAEAAAAVLSQLSPEIVLAPATLAGRAYVPLIASRLKTGLTADCTRFDIDPETGLLHQTRPAFGGNIMATIITPDHSPQMATVRPHVLPVPEKVLPETADSCFFRRIDFSDSNKSVSILQTEKSVSVTDDISNASIIVSGGRGVGGETGNEASGFPLLRRFAEEINGSVGASRSSVEAGWAPYHQQVGQTGKTVQPKVYIACAISGAVQHLVGMHDSETVIAINKDPEAPIFNAADYGFIEDYGRVIGKLVQHCRNKGAGKV